jgi:single-stranded-DNA-specific exonuclease
VSGIDLHAALQRCAPCLLGFGGHKMAAGLTIENDRVGELANALEEALSDQTLAEDLIAERRIDAEVGLAAIDAACLDDLARLEPYGAHNPEPIFLACAAKIESRGVAAGVHLKLFVEHQGRRLSAIGFGMADHPADRGDIVDILYTPMLSEWGGSVSIELRLRDLRPH